MDAETELPLNTLENGALVINGEVDGEKNCCWKGPAEVSIDSPSRLYVSSGKGMPLWPAWLTGADWLLSREYSWRSESASSSFGLPMELFTAGTWGEKSAGRFRVPCHRVRVNCTADIAYLKVRNEDQTWQTAGLQGQTYRSLVNACLPVMPSNVVKLILVARSWHGLGAEALEGILSRLIDGDRRGVRTRSHLMHAISGAIPLAEGGGRQAVVGEDEVVEAHGVHVGRALLLRPLQLLRNAARAISDAVADPASTRKSIYTTDS